MLHYQASRADSFDCPKVLSVPLIQMTHLQVKCISSFFQASF